MPFSTYQPASPTTDVLTLKPEWHRESGFVKNNYRPGVIHQTSIGCCHVNYVTAMTDAVTAMTDEVTAMTDVVMTAGVTITTADVVTISAFRQQAPTSQRSGTAR